MSKAICELCGKSHPEDEMELTFALPDSIHALEEPSRSARCHISEEFCVLDEERFFVRALISFEVIGWASDYCIGAWAEVSESAYRTMNALWRDPDQAGAPPFSGVLANAVPGSDGSGGARVDVHMTGLTTRPMLRLLDEGHSLAKEQASGISPHRAAEFTSMGPRRSVVKTSDGPDRNE